MNRECERIADALAAALSGDAWYGDPLSKILGDVTSGEAGAHPIPNAHSIWELLRHVEAWVQFALGAVRGVPIPAWSTMPAEQDWPPVAQSGEQAWKAAVNSFFSTHSSLVEAIKSLNDDRLDQTVSGRACNFYHLFHGLIQHAVYHGGQMALLKKAVTRAA